MQRSTFAVVGVLALTITLPAQAGTTRSTLDQVPRAAFGPNIPLGSIERLPAPFLAPTAKTVDGDPSDWDEGVAVTGLGGTTTVQAGQLVHQDFILDDTGTARSCVVERRDRNAEAESAAGWPRYQALHSALGREFIPAVDVAGVFSHPETECEQGVERYGASRYPDGATEGSADILELRMAADIEDVLFLVRLNALTPDDEPVVAVAVDADNDLATGSGRWDLSSGVATPGADHVLTLTRHGVLLDGAAAPGALVATDDLGAGGPDNPDGFGGVVEASVPRALLERTRDDVPVTRWRLWAGAGLWEPGAGAWRAPVTPEPGPRVMNLAFRGGVEPLRPWMDETQAFELRRTHDASGDGVARLSNRFSTVVDLVSLASGAHETWRIRPGHHVRIFESRVTDGQRNGRPHPVAEAGPVSRRQPYGLYVPTTYEPILPNPSTLWLHWRGPGEHQAAYYVPNMVRELGEDRRNVLISPRGRGSSGWYVGDSQIDVLDAVADAHAFLHLDPDRLSVAGHSMGGWGAYLLSMLYPDRFAGAMAVAAPPVLGQWNYPLAPGSPQNDRPLYTTHPLIGNARHVPTVILHGTNDPLVPASGVAAQARGYLDRQQPHRLHLFAGYEHYTFPILDEWHLGASWLANRKLPFSPARVSYARMPCLDPVHWSPLYAERADAAYWVSGIRVYDEPSAAACTSRDTPLGDLWWTGTVDVTLDRATTSPTAAGPVATVDGPPEHSGAAVTTGYDRPAAPGATRNRFDALIGNVSSFRIDMARAELPVTPPLFANIDTDRRVKIHLDGLVGGRVIMDGEDIGAFTGSVTVHPGKHHIQIQP